MFDVVLLIIRPPSARCRAAGSPFLR